MLTLPHCQISWIIYTVFLNTKNKKLIFEILLNDINKYCQLETNSKSAYIKCWCYKYITPTCRPRTKTGLLIKLYNFREKNKHFIF